jgi:hypothetical protein
MELIFTLLFVPVNLSSDLGRELADPVDSHPNWNLSDHCLIAFHLPVGVAWLPRGSQHATGKCTQVGKELRA